MMNFRKQIQMIFQDPYSSLNGRLKVKDIIAEPIKLHNPKITNNDLDNYINWDKIAKDYSLESGDISLHDTLALESIFYKFIKKKGIKNYNLIHTFGNSWSIAFLTYYFFQERIHKKSIFH